ncbi:MAG: hypothetical protein ACREVE_12145 [Gammaproteobacteria bacterium]
MSLHLLAPGLLDRAGQWARDFGPLPRFAGIEALLSRAARCAIPADGMDATLCGLFGLEPAAERDLPLGALRRLGFGRAPDRAVWLCADPVNLKADVARVYLRDSGSLAMTLAEAQQLGDLFTAHFADNDWTLEITSPACWHLRLPAVPRIITHPQRQVMGRAIEPFLPRGADAARWRALQNEAQMLFHAAEVNRVRDTSGHPLINGLWVSGAGQLPDADDLTAAVGKTWSDDPLARGLSRLAGIDTGPVPAAFDGVLADAAGGAHLVSLEQALTPARYDDFSAWCAVLTHLDRAWFAPAGQALKQGRVAQCHVYDCAGWRYSIDRARQWRLWRRARSLDILASGAAADHSAHPDPLPT